MQNTTHYNLKKPDYTDFADIQDINDNMDTIDGKLAAPDGDGRDQTVSFTDADLDTGITSFPTFLSKIASGMKLAKFLRDFKAGMGYVLHTGSLINNATCTESGKALDARMGKTLQDQITSLNDSLSNTYNVNNRAYSRTGVAISDANKPVSGLAYVNASTVGRPVDYGVLLTFKSDSIYAQLCFSTIAVDGIYKVYSRINSGVGWSTWGALN